MVSLGGGGGGGGGGQSSVSHAHIGEGSGLILRNSYLSRTFIFISIFLLAPEEGLYSNRNIGQFVSIYNFFALFFCLLLHRLAIRISLPFHIFLILRYVIWIGS